MLYCNAVIIQDALRSQRHTALLIIRDSPYEALTEFFREQGLELLSGTRVITLLSQQVKNTENALALIPVGDAGTITALLSEDIEFNQLSRICKNAVLFEGLNIDWKRPILKIARFFDKIIRNSGLEPGFCMLDEELCLKISNQMSQFLQARLSARQVRDLIDGKTTLKAIGLDASFIKELKTGALRTDTSEQFKDAKVLYLSYKKSANKQSVKANLDLVWTALNEIFEEGLKDYSLAELGRRLEKAGGPRTQSLRNPSRAQYREIISSFALAAEGSTKYVAKTKPSVEKALDMVPDPSARAVLRAALNDTKRLKVVNDNLHAAFKKLSIGAGISSKIGLSEAKPHEESPELVDNKNFEKLIPVNTGLALTAKEKLILKRSVDSGRIAQSGLSISPKNEIITSQGDVLFSTDFVNIIKRLSV